MLFVKITLNLEIKHWPNVTKGNWTFWHKLNTSIMFEV